MLVQDPEIRIRWTLKPIQFKTKRNFAAKFRLIYRGSWKSIKLDIMQHFKEFVKSASPQKDQRTILLV